ncbi:DUF2623 domain-containing protein [Pectobacterium brasiliense]|uniref:DUF2623 domain-containing protein n=1 Tax=Pectobacterium brasiliense TaxID=180957 RepID=UPI0019691E1D|nr:DUF2623 domain-containing protein [Pectobacterium brasiliense]MBN3262832.1 DUF2623 domain-containing protein [Pectobacterium brasiliense]
MGNHFERGVLAGLRSANPKSTNDINPYCYDYRRGYICGYAHNLAETKGDRQQAAFEAGLLSRRYGLERERVAEFFTEQGNPYAIRFFYAGYDAHTQR